MTDRTFPAKTEAFREVLDFVESILEGIGCKIGVIMAVSVAIEEVFVNVAHYAYGDDQGDVCLGISFDEDEREVTFILSDAGIPFNPLERPDPDITLSAEERDIGGLGIFITKKNMDSVTYDYADGKNILTMVKKV